jgi:hypothetical protein
MRVGRRSRGRGGTMMHAARGCLTKVRMTTRPWNRITALNQTSEPKTSGAPQRHTTHSTRTLTCLYEVKTKPRDHVVYEHVS